jgi:hypothetical protein
LTGDTTLFITGTQRSGTTLLERLLDTQDDVSILSQPFPLLLIEAKRAFLSSIGVEEEHYALGHLFGETRYSRRSFAEFLTRWRITRADLLAVFSRMRDYSGQYTKFPLHRLEQAFDRVDSGDDFAAVVRKLARSLAHDPSASRCGSKETICEELVPYLLDREFHCLIVLRDPRDVAASLNHGRGTDFAGSVKPTLFNVRNWRKSVAFALAMESCRGFQWCRYEDLVADPHRTMTLLGERLGIERIRVPATFLDAGGKEWKGNSSHGERKGISPASIGSHRVVLPRDVSLMIEATCLPELQFLGYETTLSSAEAPSVIGNFHEPYAFTRPGLKRDLPTPGNVGLEIERLRRIASDSDTDAEKWFLFPAVREKLRRTFR